MMVLLDGEEFIKQLTAMVAADAEKGRKSLWISYKRHVPNKRTLRNRKPSQQDMAVDEAEPVCLVRARLGNKKISTHVTFAFMEAFSMAMNDISDMMREDDMNEEQLAS